MAYGIFRSDNMTATKDPSKIKSAKYYVGTAATAIENGNIVALTSGLLSGEREVFKATTPAATNTVNEIGIVCSVELMDDERKHNLNEFRNEAGDVIRVMLVENGDIFSVTADALDTTVTPVVGTTSVTIGASTKMIVKTTSGITTENVVGKVIATETIGATTYLTIQVTC